MRSTIPRIPHLPGSNIGPDDLALTEEEARPFLEKHAVVSEKTDGVSLTVRLSAFEEVTAGLKPDWAGALGGRIARAAEIWVRINEDRLRVLLAGGHQVYGEWLWHRLAVPYETLPSAVLLYSIRDERGRLIPRRRSLERIARAGLEIVDPLFEGAIGDRPLESLCVRSAWGRVRGEGLIIEIVERGEARWAKWVRKGYRQPAPRDLTGEKNGIVDR
jgi:RNA ligase-like protein